MARRFQQRRLGRKQRRTFASTVLEDTPQQKPSRKFFILSIFYTFIQYLISFFRPKINNSESNSGLTNRIEQLETTVAKLSKKIVKLEKKFSSSTPPLFSNTQAPTITLAPPPPPPPILSIPPPPPPPPLGNIPALPKYKKSAQAPQKQKSSFLPAPIGISVDAIKNLKLKKVSDQQNEGSKSGAKSNKVQLVTMQDLQNVKLKRRTQQTDENKNILPLSKLKLTKSLKKTNIIRSPGGTPLVKKDENQSTGTGLTPAFTRALKKKFEAVHKTSPISIEESPKSWRC